MFDNHLTVETLPLENGGSIVISYDEDPTNPRTECDNETQMVCWHGRYNLGDKNEWRNPKEFLHDLGGYQIEAENVDTGPALRRIEKLGYVIQPLFLYDHSGITISTSPFSCRFDSGQVGWVYINRRKLKLSTKQALDYIQGDVKAYDNYLRGECYRFEILDAEGEVVDSCGGYDDLDLCRLQAHGSV
jgi:hypothetical protein